MRLIDLLPDYYEKNITMGTLQGILSEVTEALETAMYEAVDQCFVDSATYALERYERLLGLEPDVQKSDRYRRERIKSKMVGAGITTKSLIEHISRSFTNGEVEVTEQFSKYTVTVRFTGTSGIPGNIGDIKAAIEEAIPAHLRVIYEYIFNTYGSVGTFTHKELAAYTHRQIRNGHLKNRIRELAAYQYEELVQLTHKQISKGELPNGN